MVQSGMLHTSLHVFHSLRAPEQEREVFEGKRLPYKGTDTAPLLNCGAEIGIRNRDFCGSREIHDRVVRVGRQFKRRLGKTPYLVRTFG
jgi:hypothetical protein